MRGVSNKHCLLTFFITDCSKGVLLLLILFVIYFRKLLTHTVNNLQQKLKYAKLIQISVVKQNFNTIYIMCENFRTIPLVLYNIKPFQYKRVKTESHNNWNLGLSLHFSGTISISFVMSNIIKSYFIIRIA